MEICIFPKRLTHDFGEKLKLIYWLFLVKKGRKTTFEHVLDREQDLQDHKTIML